jgi:excisionase family DNA binding protein
MQHLAEPAFKVSDVAACLNVEEKTICRLFQKGSLSGFKVTGLWRFQKYDLENWIAEQKSCASSAPNR